MKTTEVLCFGLGVSLLLKQECVKSKLAIAIEVSEDFKKEFEREPIAQAWQELPSQEEIDKHELTQLPRQPWCEACQAGRSREDNFSESKPEEKAIPAFSFDYLLTGTEPDGEKDPLSVHLIGVCNQTKYCMVVSAPAKGQESLLEATKEIAECLLSLVTMKLH